MRVDQHIADLQAAHRRIVQVGGEISESGEPGTGHIWGRLDDARTSLQEAIQALRDLKKEA